MYTIKCILINVEAPVITAFTFDIDKRIGELRKAKEWADRAMVCLGYNMDQYTMKVVR